MATRILLVNPPIYDFSAYDFWLKPYGLLRVAGLLRKRADLHLFDYLDRFCPLHPIQGTPRSDSWGTGKFHSQLIPKPSILESIPRRYRRYGIPRDYLKGFLTKQEPFDFALIQTGMTYWYLGVKEVIEDLRGISPQTKVVLGGVYATLSPRHAESLGADLVVKGSYLEPLWKFQTKPRGASILGGLSHPTRRCTEAGGWLSFSMHLLFRTASGPEFCPPAPGESAR